jgi:hypothetical protein
MMKVEESIDAGKLRMKPEVCVVSARVDCWWLWLCSPTQTPRHSWVA